MKLLVTALVVLTVLAAMAQVPTKNKAHMPHGSVKDGILVLSSKGLDPHQRVTIQMVGPDKQVNEFVVFGFEEGANIQLRVHHLPPGTYIVTWPPKHRMVVTLD